MVDTQKFLTPSCAAHRQYEALRSHFVDGLSAAEAANRWGYTYGSFRVLCHQFNKWPTRRFFVDNIQGALAEESDQDPEYIEIIVSLRKQNFSVYDIARSLEATGKKLSPPAIAQILKKNGFTRLPRRTRDNRLNSTEISPDPAPISDVNKFNPNGSFTTKFGGLYLFLSYLVDSNLDRISYESGLPGTNVVPADYAIRSILALKLFGSARMGHVMSYAFDQGLALFAGLNSIPKRSFLSEYSCRVDPLSVRKFIEKWFLTTKTLGLESGDSFDVDFHTIPFHGDDPLVEKHYVSKRSRKQKGSLAFLVWDSVNTHFCFGNADIPSGEQANEILKFAEYWKTRQGGNNCYPKELIFDSTLTTYENLAELNKLGIQFITLRRKSANLLNNIESQSPNAWKRITLENVSRQYRNPRIIDEFVILPKYGTIRQISIKDLGHEKPTILITNQDKISPAKLVGRYAQRMVIENGIADSIEFFHLDALSSSVALRVDCDLMITLMAGTIYRMFAKEIGGAYRTAKFLHIFRDFIDAVADIKVTDSEVQVKYQRRTHNPILMRSGIFDKDIIVPWWQGRRLKFLMR
jgi:hypothetical protein